VRIRAYGSSEQLSGEGWSGDASRDSMILGRFRFWGCCHCEPIAMEHILHFTRKALYPVLSYLRGRVAVGRMK